MGNSNLEDKVAYRIIKILRIVAYIPLPILLLVGLFDIGRDYHYATSSYTWNFGNAFLWLFFASLVYILIVEFIYKGIFYIIFGKRK